METTGNADWVIDLSTGLSTRITSDPARCVRRPCGSSEGRQIVPANPGGSQGSIGLPRMALDAPSFSINIQLG